jgi:hypothetical protein
MSIQTSHFIIETKVRVDQADLFEIDQNEMLFNYKFNFSQLKRSWLSQNLL